MVRRRARRHIRADINIVPLLDVLLVLVLIFIATAPILTQSVEVALPDADATNFKTVGHDDNLPIILEVYGINQYRLLFEHQRWEQLLTEQVILGARAHMNTNPTKVFLIGGAKNVPYNEIIKVLNFLHQAGVKSVGLMTHPI